jgi:hypothetical protein
MHLHNCQRTLFHAKAPSAQVLHRTRRMRICKQQGHHPGERSTLSNSEQASARNAWAASLAPASPPWALDAASFATSSTPPTMRPNACHHRTLRMHHHHTRKTTHNESCELTHCKMSPSTVNSWYHYTFDSGPFHRSIDGRRLIQQHTRWGCT